MSYQAIARKWRPTTFSGIAGQDHVTRTLQNALRLGRIHHALLFTGARGVGKTTAARAMARALNCEKGPTPDPCGECSNCTEALAGASPDIVEIDGASNNSVNDIRELRDTVSYLPSKGKYRVFIIDEVHMLSQGAFNALLKTLEEPPPHVVFLFATTEPQKIPDTVLSRVQRFDFKRISATVVSGHLRTICDAEGIKISDVSLRIIARAGEGSMRDAQSLLDQVIAFGGEDITDQQVGEILGLVDREILYNMLEGLVTGDPGLCLDAIARVHDFGFELSQFTAELLELLRNATLVVLSESARKHVDAPQEELDRLIGMADKMSVDVLSQWFQALLEVHDQVARSPYPRLVLEMAVARLAQARPVRPVDELLGRMEDLERSLRHGGAGPKPGGGGGQSRPGGPGGNARGPSGGGGGHRASPPQVHSPPPTRGGHEPPRASAAPPSTAPPSTAPQSPQPMAETVSTVVIQSGNQATAAAVAPASSAAEVGSDSPPASSSRGASDAAPFAPSQDGAPFAPPDDGAPFAPHGGQQRSEPQRGGQQRGGQQHSEPQRGGRRGAPSLTLHTDNEARYRDFLTRLRKEGLRYDVMIEYSVFDGQHGDTLHIAFREGFLLSRGKHLVEDRTVVELARRMFPGVRRLEASVREGDQGKTRREARAERRERHRESLWQEAKKDEVIQNLLKTLDAEIEDVVPLSFPEED